jgi:hypothetical protein
MEKKAWGMEVVAELEQEMLGLVLEQDHRSICLMSSLRMGGQSG